MKPVVDRRALGQYELSGEIVLFIMINYGFVPGQNLKEAIGNSVRTGIAACECLRKFEFVANMSRTVTAKTQSRLLRAGEVE